MPPGQSAGRGHLVHAGGPVRGLCRPEFQAGLAPANAKLFPRFHAQVFPQMASALAIQHFVASLVAGYVFGLAGNADRGGGEGEELIIKNNRQSTIDDTFLVYVKKGGDHYFP